MQIIILADAGLKEEWTSQGVESDVRVEWISTAKEFLDYTQADAFVDLCFQPDEERIKTLNMLKAPVFINSVVYTLKETSPTFIRINGWNTFLKTPLIEAAAEETQRPQAEKIMALFNRKMQWLLDEPGFITPRVIAMIINEAFLALEQNISSKNEIDAAMKLGTSYPYGPFQWAEKIGERNISLLLQKLTSSDSRYQPSQLLLEHTDE